ncbi:uncharacterized protein LOC132755296 isoform X2 [Ruditapes philippinarum]|uniref:uncharacterized protein LOC132755296 isoform X2 n=1 Tax=Ruditapes philippinarum TaxID=129788 RepID=UPI00295AABD6|nr:uncharacterized protein LOC132755296 isoform X2 [Ruditapes philippinarum]
MLQLGATILLLFGLLAYSSATSCSGHVRELKDVGRRGPSYVIKSSSEPYISDSTLPAGWYFAKDSARYYTLVNGTAPTFAHCGTYSPIYIKDKLGELDEGKEYLLTACLLAFDSSCQHRYSIKLRKCGQQIQYYLLPTDGTSAYCFEPSSFSVEEPAPDYIIPDNIQVSVALMYRRENNSLEPELDFKCNFESASNRYYYGVSWVLDGKIERTFSPVKVNDVDGTNLNETTLGRLGFKFGLTIQCAVKVSSTATGDQTIPQMSDTFYAGIKVLTPQITLNSGSPKSILVLPTIPLGCRRPDGLPDTLEEHCDLDIEMIDTNTKYSCQDTSLTSLRNQNLCGSKITGWRNATSQPCMHSHNAELCSYSSIKRRLTTTSIQIAASNDQLQYPTDKTFTVQLKTGNTAPHSFWEDVQLDDVTVRYTGGSQNNKWKGKICSVVNYPTLATFDGSWNWPYQSYINDSGHYLLYKNTESLAEVQIKTQFCGADSSLHSYTSSCTCAAAIQSDGDVFLIDICTEIKRAEFTHRRGNVLNVREVKDTQYEVYLPTGTKVRIEIRFYHISNFLNVYVTPSPSDVTNTEGLCGNLDGSKENVNNVYFEKWKLQRSLFNTMRYNLPSTRTYNHNVCICPRAFPNETFRVLQNGHKDDRATCFSQQYATCTENIQLPGEKKTFTLKNKRSIARHRRNVERLLDLSFSCENSNTRFRKVSIILYQVSSPQSFNLTTSLNTHFRPVHVKIIVKFIMSITVYNVLISQFSKLHI